jgi:hypothetical protein
MLKVINPNRNSILKGEHGEALLAKVKEMNQAFIHSLLRDTEGIVSFHHRVQEMHPYMFMREQMPHHPHAYLIGTMPPSSYLRNLPLPHLGMGPIGNLPFKVNGEEVSEQPSIDFYHGNECALWHHLGIEPMSENDVLKFLMRHDLVYADIVQSCSRNRGINDASDGGLKEIVPNVELLKEILSPHGRPPVLWFTSSSVYNSRGIELNRKGFVKTEGGQAYNLFLRSMQMLDVKIELSFMNNHMIKIHPHAIESMMQEPNHRWLELHRKNHALLEDCNYQYQHWIRLNDKIYTVLTGPSPSGQANRALGRNLLYQHWMKNGHLNSLSPSTAYKKSVYKLFMEYIGAYDKH